MAIGNRANVNAVLVKQTKIGAEHEPTILDVEHPLNALKTTDDNSRTGATNREGAIKTLVKLIVDPVFDGYGEHVIIDIKDQIKINGESYSLARVDEVAKKGKVRLWKIEAEK